MTPAGSRSGVTTDKSNALDGNRRTGWYFACTGRKREQAIQIEIENRGAAFNAQRRMQFEQPSDASPCQLIFSRARRMFVRASVDCLHLRAWRQDFRQTFQFEEARGAVAFALKDGCGKVRNLSGKLAFTLVDLIAHFEKPERSRSVCCSLRDSRKCPESAISAADSGPPQWDSAPAHDLPAACRTAAPAPR